MRPPGEDEAPPAGAPDPGDGPALPEGLDQAAHLLVALDYDGTLAPFHQDPAQARPLPGILPVLTALARLPRVSVAVVSGRPVQQLERLLQAPDLPSAPLVLVGEHGWESRDGPRQRRKSLAAELELRLERAYQSAIQAGAGARLERKRAALVLHLRGVPRAEAQALERACRELWTPLLEAGEPGQPADPPGGLRLEAIDGGLELRATAHDKGTVLRELIATLPPGTLTLYVGDDRTDEDAFRVLAPPGSPENGAPRGLAVRVARDARETAAHATLVSCEDVRDWLERLQQHLAWHRAGGRAG